MRKLIFALVATTLFLGACSSSTNTSYQKNLKKSIDQMNEMAYDDAIKTLNTMLEKDLPGDRFEPRRTYIVENLIDEAEYMKDHIDSLTESYELAMDLYEQVDKEDLDSLVETYKALENAITSFGDMTQLDMHKELTEAKEDIESALGTLIASYEKDFHDGIEQEDFSISLDALNALQYAADIVPGYYPDDIYALTEELREIYNTEIEKYSQLPISVTAWSDEIVKNDLGSIELIGAQATDSSFKLYVKLTDDHAKAGSALSLSPELITKNGHKLGAYNNRQVTYEDYTMLVYTFDNYENEPVENIVRADFGSENEYTVDFSGKADSLVDIPGVKSITGTFSPDITLKHDDYTIHVTEIDVAKEEMIFKGTINPTKDITLRDYHGVYFPASHKKHTIGSSGFSRDDEFYGGTEQEFSIHTALNYPVTEYNDTARIQLYNLPFVFNFADEKEGKLEKSEFLHVLPSNSPAEPYYNQGIKKIVKNQDKKTVDSNSLLYIDSYSSDHTIELGSHYKTLTTTLHITEAGKDEDYGDFEVNFYAYNADGDNDLLHSETLKEKHKAKELKIDVKGVDRLIIEFKTPFFKSFPGIILEKPFVE